MSIVWCRRINKGSSFSGSWDEDNRGERKTYKFLVRVDSLVEPEANILAATGITYGKQHGTRAILYAADADISCEDGSGLLWLVTWVYREQKDKAIVDTATNLPKTEWKASGSMRSIGMASHWYKDSAVAAPVMRSCRNSAGQPIEGLKKNIPSIKWSITKAYPTAAAWMNAAAAFNGTINSVAYGGAPKHTWFASFGNAEKKKFKKLTINNPGDSSKENAGATGTITEVEYWSVSWEIEWNRLTWDHKVFEQGYMQKADDKGTPSASGTKLVVIKGADGKSVKDPVMLTADGLELPSTSTPVVVNNGNGFQAYEEVDFATYLGAYPT